MALLLPAGRRWSFYNQRKFMRYLLLLLVAFGLTAQIPGTFRVTGPVAPPATNSNLGASLPVYNYGGFLTGLTSLSQLQDLNRYPLARRHAGQVASLTTGAQYILGADLTSWYNTGSVSNMAQLRTVEPGADGGVVTVDGYYSETQGGAFKAVVTNSITGTNAWGGKVVAFGGVKSWLIDESKLNVLQFGASPDFLQYYTNNGNASQITIDSTGAFQAATDFISANGGGSLFVPSGDYKVSTVYCRPNVSYIGASPVTGFEGNALSPSDGYSARTASQSTIHGTGEGANGDGIPIFVLDGPTYYTNQSHVSFTSLDGDSITYYSGGNSFLNLGLMPGYRWAWNGGYPTAGIVINQVDGVTIQGCNFQTIAGVGVYILGGRGLVMRDNLLRGCVISGTFITDTSDALFEGNIYNNASANWMGHQANTMEIKRNALWNTREDLVRYSGAVTTEVQFGIPRGFATPRTGWLADATTDIVSVNGGIGADTGIPIVFRGESLPGGLDTNTVYYPRFTAGTTTNWYLTTSAYKALFATNLVDITTAGGSGTWWCETLSGGIAAWNGEEIFANNNRLDQNWDMSVSLRNINRATVSGNEIWEIGFDQTVGRFNTRSTNETLRGILIVDSTDVTVTGNEFLGSFNTSSQTYPFVFEYSGVDIYKSGNVQISANQANFLDQLVNVDSESTGITVDGGVGVFANKVIKSSSASVPSRYDGANFVGTNYIWATIPTANTNISGDFNISLNADFPEAQADNTYIPLFLLGSESDATGSPGAVTAYGLACFGYMSTTNCLLTLRQYGATLSDYTERRYAATEWNGKAIRMTFQRTNGVQEIWLDGVKMVSAIVTAGSPPAESDAIYAPYVLLGPWTANLFSTNRIYRFAGTIGQSYGYKDLNRGAGFQQRGNMVWDWDFKTASGTIVPDMSGSGVDGAVVNLDVSQPLIFGNYTNSAFSGNPGTIGQVLKSDGAGLSPYFQDSYDDAIYAMRQLGSSLIAQPILANLFTASTPQNMSDGQLRVVAARVNQTTTVTGVAFWQRTTGDYTATDNNRVGLYTIANGTLTLVASSANDGDLWKSGTTAISKKAFSTPYVAQPGVYFIAALYNQSAQVTQPTLSMASLVSAIQGEVDLANSAKLSAVLAAQADLPSSVAMSTMTVAGANVCWLALY